MDVTDVTTIAANATKGMSLTQEPVFGLPVTTGGVGIWALVVMVLIGLIKVWPNLAKIRTDSNDSLRAVLLNRIARLEERCDSNEKECEERIARSIATNDAIWRQRFEEMRSEHSIEIKGLRTQIVTLQVTMGRDFSSGITSQQAIPHLEEILTRVDEADKHQRGSE